jgi:antitoxin (DNA-binding transcriptional repressor) of toxin-antitoxin stability system
MKEFTYSEARQQLAALLDRARHEGAVRIRRRDGQVFVLAPERRRGSPLDVPSIALDLNRDEIVSLVHEGRREPLRPRRPTRR